MRVFEKLSGLPIAKSGERAPRCSLSSKVTITELRESHTIEAIGLNISRSGILCRYLESAWPGWTLKDRVKVRIAADVRYFSEDIVSIGRIVRLIEDKDGNDVTIRIGVEFVE